MDLSCRLPDRTGWSISPGTQHGHSCGQVGNGPHDNMMQLNSCNTFARGLNAQPSEGDGRQENTEGGAYEVMDEQFTCPHVRLPMQRPFQIQEWRNQDATHAFTHPPRLLILQVSRFLHTDRGIRKIRKTFQLQRKINIPIFSDHAGNIEQIPYILSGGVLHVGQVVTAAHYQAFYFPGDSVDPWSTHMIPNDGQTAQPGTDATRQAIHTNCHLLAYTRERG